MIHDQAAAFALDALDHDEAARFTQHLAVCPGCEDALEPLQLAAAALAFAGELPPPRPDLRRRVLAVGVVVPLRRRARPFVAAAMVAAACVVVTLVLVDGRARGPADTRAYPLRGAKGALLVSATGEAVLVVRRLPAAPRGRAYDIWIVRAGRAARAGVLRGAMAKLTRPVPRGSEVAVTLEPASGSATPTGPTVLRAGRT